MTPLAFAEAGFPIIPVQLAPKPNGGWRKQPMAKWSLATTEPGTVERWWSQWPDALPAIPLARMGWAVVDADRHAGGVDGVAAVTGLNEDGTLVLGPLGPHSKIATPSGGLHLVFAQPAQPIKGRFDWCPGVEVLGEGCLLTCYDLEELKFPRIAPRAILPKIFWNPQDSRQADLIKKSRADRSVRAAAARLVQRHSLVHALRQLNPLDFREYKEWFALMTACCFEGISERDFVDWSIGDPTYAADGPIIRKMWRKLRPAHGGALWAALKEAGIKVSGRRTEPPHGGEGSVINEVRFSEGASNSRPEGARVISSNWRSRINSILQALERNSDEPMLFWAACAIAEVMGDVGKPTSSVAEALLESACKACGLWKEIGADECRRTITNGLRFVELKILATGEMQR